MERLQRLLPGVCPALLARGAGAVGANPAASTVPRSPRKMTMRTIRQYGPTVLLLFALLLPSAPAAADSPIADAGGELWATKYVSLGHINPSTRVELDGSRSYDPDGDSITFDWYLLAVPSGSSASLEFGTDPARPTFYADKEGLYTVGLVVSDGTSDSALATAQIEAKTRTIGTINWGNPLTEDAFGLFNITPSIAMNDAGVVVAVFHRFSNLYYRVGQRQPGGFIEWGEARSYTDGWFPSAALSNSEPPVVVEAHQGLAVCWNHWDPLPRTCLYYKVGVVDVDRKTIAFGDSKRYDNGVDPSVALNDDGVVVEVHQGDRGNIFNLYYKVGEVNPSTKRIDFGGSEKYTTGRGPSVALNNHNVVVETHSGSLSSELWARAGVVDRGNSTISFGPGVKYTEGLTPSIAINDDGIVVETHNSLTDGWYHTGVADGAGLSLSPARAYSSGAYTPGVAINNEYQLLEMHATLAVDEDVDFYGMRYHSTAVFEPTRNPASWMDRTPSVMCRPLQRAYLPGTHDSGAYDFTRGHRSPDYQDILATIEDVLDDLDLDFGADMIEDCVHAFAQAQGTTILVQLRGGIRYLDLRIFYDDEWPRGPGDGPFYIHHSAVAANLNGVLKEIKTYLESVGKELLVVQSWVNSQVVGDDVHAELMGLIVDELELGPYLYQNFGPADQAERDAEVRSLLGTSIEDIVKDGPKIIWLYKNKEEEDNPDYLTRACLSLPDGENPPENCKYFWPYFDDEDWANTDSLAALYNNQRAALLNYFGEGHAESKVFRLQWILTPQAPQFVGYWLETVQFSEFRNSLHSLSQRANQYLGMFIERHPALRGLLTVDFFEESDVVAQAIRLNRIDDLAPVVEHSLSPAPNAAGWNNTDVTVSLAIERDCPPGGLNTIYYSLSGAQNGGGEMLGDRGEVVVSAEGVTTIAYHAVDAAGNVGESQSVEVRVDKTAPEVVITASPAILWPPNGKLVDVTVNGWAVDAVSGLGGELFGVVDEYGSVEPVLGGFGDVIQLEARRRGTDRDGRTYVVWASAVDLAGNEAAAEAIVECPHDQR